MHFSEQMFQVSSIDDCCHPVQNPDLVTTFLNLYECMPGLNFTCLTQRQTKRNAGMHMSIGKKLLCFMGFVLNEHYVMDHWKAQLCSYWAMESPKLQVWNWSHFERGGRLDAHLRFLLLHCFYWFFYNPIKIVIILLQEEKLKQQGKNDNQE